MVLVLGYCNGTMVHNSTMVWYYDIIMLQWYGNGTVLWKWDYFVEMVIWYITDTTVR